MDGKIKIDREKYLSHINDFEQLRHMNRILDMVEIVVSNYTVQTTDFLDPFIIRLASSLLNSFPQIAYSSFGGYEEAERQIMAIYPNYHYFTEEDSGLVALRLLGPVDDLSHRDFLGAFIATGIDRSRLGDIVIGKNYADLIVKREVADYIYTSLNKVSRNSFEILEINFSEIVKQEEATKLISTSLASLRLDAYIAGAYRLSRADSQNLIKASRVKLNFEPVNKSSMEVDQGDLISIRGYGRSQLDLIKGRSKKDKIRVEIKIFL